MEHSSKDKSRRAIAERGRAAGIVKVGWRPGEWAYATGLSHSSVYNLLARGAIKSRLVGPRVRLITTSPEEFLAAQGNELAQSGGSSDDRAAMFSMLQDEIARLKELSDEEAAAPTEPAIDAAVVTPSVKVDDSTEQPVKPKRGRPPKDLGERIVAALTETPGVARSVLYAKTGAYLSQIDQCIENGTIVERDGGLYVTDERRVF
jgi:hypothetical protein